MCRNVEIAIEEKRRNLFDTQIAKSEFSFPSHDIGTPVPNELLNFSQYVLYISEQQKAFVPAIAFLPTPLLECVAQA